MSALAGAQRLVQRARLTPWRVERILDETAALRDDVGRLRVEVDTAGQVLGDSLMEITRALDEFTERIAANEDRIAGSDK